VASVTRDARNGNVVVRVYAKKDPASGREIKPSRSLPPDATQAEIQDAIDALELEAGFGKKTGRRMTIGGLLAYYLDTRKRTGMSPKTLESYESAARCYVYPYIGDVPYAKAGAGDFDGLYLELRESGGRHGQGIAQTTVKKLHSMLSGCFATLVRADVVERNVLAGMKVECGRAPEARPLSEDEFGRLKDQVIADLRDLAKEACAAAVWTVMYTGVRRGEVGGLRVGSFKPAAKTVRVAESLIRVARKGLVYKDPKSKTSKRILAVDDVTVDVLKLHVGIQAAMLAEAGITQTSATPLFALADGSPMDPADIYGYFKAAAKAAGIGEWPKLHTLRHTHVTYLIDQGVNDKIIQKRLGHHSIKVTYDIYGHLMPGGDESAATSFAAATADLGGHDLEGIGDGTTCRYISTDGGHPACDICGHRQPPESIDLYCPHCGRRIDKEEAA